MEKSPPLLTLWEKMMEANNQKSSSDFMSTHPASEKRAQALEELQPPMQKIYAKATSSGRLFRLSPFSQLTTKLE